ncbi:MAG: DUF1800 domain-containing protein [Planctomycetota bacterium]|nr:DUF1800 domain-containing protein [Planctomycetota bacterium]
MQKIATLALVGALCTLALLLQGSLPLAGAEDVAGDDAQTAKIRHLLRRATFGARTGDVETVKEMGIEAWIDRQLEPQQIPDPEVDKRLEGFETLKMTTGEYIARLRGDQMMGADGPPGKGEDRIEMARRRQAERNRLRNQGANEVPRAILTRAVYSERQLQQVMAEFWRNHFNVDVTKDDVRYYIPDWEREVIYRHMFGSFEDFLMATAKHPAMLFYLDNHVSQAPMARAERVVSGREDVNRTGGLNENYARELMELHTVGADNGYDQDDVIQLSLVLTGWSIQDGNFSFRPSYHARGTKRVMGKAVKGDDVEEGEAVVEYLAKHKLTREFVIQKMARFLQSDEPSPKLVEDTIKVWTKTKGDLKAVTKAILMHDDFYAKPSVLTKAKTPYEFAISAIRVTGADMDDAGAVLSRLDDMGQPTLRQQDPTGYSDAAMDWMDTGVLAVRWQFAYDLLADRLPGVRMANSPLYEHLRQKPEVWEYLLQDAVFAGERPGSLTMAPFRRRVNDVRRDYRKLRIQELKNEFNILTTLLLGSPEFQRQ